MIILRYVGQFGSVIYATEGNEWWTKQPIYYGRFHKVFWVKTRQPEEREDLVKIEDVTHSWDYPLPIVTKNIKKEKYIKLYNSF